MSRRLSFTEDRRRKLRRQMELLRLESRTTITEPISLTGLALSWMRGVSQLGLISPFMGSNALSGLGRQVPKANQARDPVKPAFAPRRNLLAPILSVHASESSAGGGGGAFDGTDPALSTASQGTLNDWLSLTAAPAIDGSEHGISLPWHPAKPNGGGAAMAPRGGSNPASPMRTSARGAITPLPVPPSTPAASSAGGSAALLAAAGWPLAAICAQQQPSQPTRLRQQAAAELKFGKPQPAIRCGSGRRRSQPPESGCDPVDRFRRIAASRLDS